MVAVGNKAREDTVGGRSDQRGHTADGGRVGDGEQHGDAEVAQQVGVEKEGDEAREQRGGHHPAGRRGARAEGEECDGPEDRCQQDRPDDFVIATGETHSVREFAQRVFEKLNLDYEKYVAIDRRYFRPTEVDILLGEASKARNLLYWRPRVSFEGLIDMMIAADMESALKEKTLCEAGYEIGNHNQL